MFMMGVAKHPNIDGLDVELSEFDEWLTEGWPLKPIKKTFRKQFLKKLIWLIISELFLNQ